MYGYGETMPPGGPFFSVDAGRVHACGVKTDQSIVCWGDGMHGQSTPPDGSFTSVSAGSSHTCGIRTDESVVCWGSEGFGPFWEALQTLEPDRAISPEATPPNGSFTYVSAGVEHSCGVKTDESIVCWGSNTSGGATPPAGEFTSVSAGFSRTCGVKTDDSIVCWGGFLVVD